MWGGPALHVPASVHQPIAHPCTCYMHSAHATACPQPWICSWSPGCRLGNAQTSHGSRLASPPHVPPCVMATWPPHTPCMSTHPDMCAMGLRHVPMHSRPTELQGSPPPQWCNSQVTQATSSPVNCPVPVFHCVAWPHGHHTHPTCQNMCLQPHTHPLMLWVSAGHSPVDSGHVQHAPEPQEAQGTLTCTILCQHCQALALVPSPLAWGT